MTFSQKGSIGFYWLIGIVCLVALVFFYTHFYPGAMSPDSVSMLSQARSGEVSDAHPVLFTYFWRLVDSHIIEGPVGILVFNLAAYYSGLFLFFISIAHSSRVLSVVGCTVVAFYPPLVGIIGVVWTDITMASLFMFIIGLSVFILTMPCIRHALSVWLPMLLMLLFCVISTRHNAAAAAVPVSFLIIVLILKVLKRELSTKTLVKAGMLSIVTVFIMFGTSRYLNESLAQENKHFWRSTVMYDLSYISCDIEADLLEGFVDNTGGIENLCALYSPKSYIPLVLGTQVHAEPNVKSYQGVGLTFKDDSPEFNRALSDFWVSSIVDNPISYLSHRFGFVIALTTRNYGPLWAPVYDAVHKNDLGIKSRNKVKSEVFEKIRNMSLKSNIYVPMNYILLSIAIVFASLMLMGFNQPRKYKVEFLIINSLAISGLLHFIGVTFFAVSSDFRFSHYLILSTVLSFSYFAVCVLLICRYYILAGEKQKKIISFFQEHPFVDKLGRAGKKLILNAIKRFT